MPDATSGSSVATGGARDQSSAKVRESADALMAEGRARDAIALLTAANARDRDPLLEIALVEARHAGFDRVDDRIAVPAAAPVPVEPVCDIELVDGVPRVAPAGLGLGVLRRSLARYGCLLVPELIPSDRVERLVDGIDRTFDEFDRWQTDPHAGRDDEARAWFSPFRPAGRYGGRDLGGRLFTRKTGGIWTVDSPRMLFAVSEMFEQVGLADLVTAQLGERPALSAAKCNLRRTPFDIPGGWHQDGSFLGRDIATLDVWIALTDCGRDAAGLEIVPHRFDELLEPGPDSVVIPHETVLSAITSVDADVVNPEYHAGDVLIFDHMFVHRTAIAPGMHRERHALETWFFAPSRYPDTQIPLLY
jgi:hypothetical protein